MKIVDNSITIDELKLMSANYFVDMVKAVVDIETETLAIDAELHADLEQYLLTLGCKQESLWGFNIYPEMEGDDFIEFDSMINIRPYDNNRSRYVESEDIRNIIIAIVNKKVSK